MSVTGGSGGRSDFDGGCRPVGPGFRVAADESIKGWRVQGLRFEQFLSYQFQLRTVLQENRFGLGVGLIENALHFFVDFLRGPFAAIPLESAVDSWQEPAVLALGATHQS